MVARSVETRRAASQPVERDPGHQIDDRPQSALRERGEDAGADDRRQRLGDHLRRVGEQRRCGGHRPTQCKQAVRPKRARQPIDAHQTDQRQHRFAEEPERQRAADRNLREERQDGAPGQEGADFGHVPIGAHGQEKVEQEGYGDQAERLDQSEPAKASDQRHDRASGVDSQCDRRAAGIEPRHVDPRSGQKPKAQSIVAHVGKERERRRVEPDQGGRIRTLGECRPQERKSARAGDRRDDRLVQRDRRVERQGKRGQTGQRRKHRRGGSAGVRGRDVHVLGAPFRLSLIPRQ